MMSATPGISNLQIYELGGDPTTCYRQQTLGPGEVNMGFKGHTVQHAKIQHFPSFIATNPPVYYLKFVKNEASDNTLSSGNPPLPYYRTDNHATLDVQIDPLLREVSGNGEVEKTYYYDYDSGGWSTIILVNTQVTWVTNWGTAVSSEWHNSFLDPNSWQTNTFHGLSDYGNYPLEPYPTMGSNVVVTVQLDSFEAVGTWNYKNDGHHSDGSVSAVYTLSEPYTLAMLQERAKHDLEEITSRSSWEDLPWAHEVELSVPGDICTDERWKTNVLHQATSKRYLEADETSLSRRRTIVDVKAKTASNVLYTLNWLEIFHPDDAMASNEVTRACSVQFLGTGGEVFVGHPENDHPTNRPTYVALSGPDAQDAFLLHPPTPEMGNGTVRVTVFKVEITNLAGVPMARTV